MSKSGRVRYIAIAYDKLQLVELLLDLGVDVEVKNKNGDASLLMAAQNSSPSVVHALLQANPSIFVTSRSGETALHWVAYSGDKRVMSLLLIAADKRNLDVIVTLLAAKANPNARNRFRITPLHHASENNRLAIAGKLVASGPNMSLRNTGEHAALDIVNQHREVGPKFLFQK